MEGYIVQEIPLAEQSTRMYSIGFNVFPEFMFEISNATQERFPHHVSLI